MASSSARLYGVREETLLSSELSAVSQRCRDTPEVRLRLSRWLPPLAIGRGECYLSPRAWPLR